MCELNKTTDSPGHDFFNAARQAAQCANVASTRGLGDCGKSATDVPLIVRELRQRQQALESQRSQLDEKLCTLRVLLSVFEG